MQLVHDTITIKYASPVGGMQAVEVSLQLDLALQRAVLGPGPERQSRARPTLPRISRACRGRSAW